MQAAVEYMYRLNSAWAVASLQGKFGCFGRGPVTPHFDLPVSKGPKAASLSVKPQRAFALALLDEQLSFSPLPCEALR